MKTVCSQLPVTWATSGSGRVWMSKQQSCCSPCTRHSGDPLAGLQLMVERAQDNLRRFQAKQPLVGHLLPYLTFEEAKQQGLQSNEEQGWVEVVQQ